MEAGMEEMDERLDVRDFICSSSSSISRPNMSLVERWFEELDELYS